MTRSPQEVFQHHTEALVAGDLDELAADYTDDSVLITASGVVRGRAAIRQAFADILQGLPDAEWDLPAPVLEGDVLLIEWRVEAGTVRLAGADTLVFADGHIRAQTVHVAAQDAG